jgi:hypothetical protein
MPSAPAPSMLKMWPPEVCFCMTCMAALVHSSVPTMLVLTTCCNCSGEESMKACSSGYFDVFLGKLMLAGTALGLTIPCSAAVLDVVHHQGIDWK